MRYCKSLIHLSIFIAHCLFLSCIRTTQAAKKVEKTNSASSLPITITGSGIDELHKDDVAIIFYITVTTKGDDAVQLLVNSTRCCQKFKEGDKDCESMRPLGGDMGKLYPGDTRNLTLVYTNLYLHDRVGECDFEIKNSEGVTMKRTVPFNTKLIRTRDSNTHIPRLLKNYYRLEEVTDCRSADENPLDECRPYECEVRYDGFRNYYNPNTRLCQVVPKCLPKKKDKAVVVAYVVETNTCKSLRKSMTEEEFSEFHAGKPSIHALAHAHGYPINVQCHNGRRDPKGKWCKCNKGWDSAPFDHKAFNPNVHVYHMCTVWTGELSAEEARNITVKAKGHHATTNAVVFSLIGVVFFLLCSLLTYVLIQKKKSRPPPLDKGERLGLTNFNSDVED